MLIEKGGHVRGITKVSGTYLDPVRKLLDNGEEVRHIDQYQGAFMLVGDKKESISSINVNIEDPSLDDPSKRCSQACPRYCQRCSNRRQGCRRHKSPTNCKSEQLGCLSNICRGIVVTYQSF